MPRARGLGCRRACEGAYYARLIRHTERMGVAMRSASKDWPERDYVGCGLCVVCGVGRLVARSAVAPECNVRMKMIRLMVYGVLLQCRS